MDTKVAFHPDLVSSADSCCRLEFQSEASDVSVAPPPILTFSSSNAVVGNILIVSESKAVELLRAENGEYLTTTPGTFIDDSDDDFRLYAAQIDVPKLKSGAIRLTGK